EAVVVAALGDRIEMRAHPVRGLLRRRAGQLDYKVRRRVIPSAQPRLLSSGSDYLQSGGFDVAIRRTRDAEARGRDLAHRLEQLRGVIAIGLVEDGAQQIVRTHGYPLCWARRSQRSVRLRSMRTPPMRSAMRATLCRSQYAARPSMIPIMAAGSRNEAVPTCTAVAPARRCSTASAALMMPPQPMTGMLTARAHWNTMRTITGRMAGPDRPPITLPSLGLRVSVSIDMPSSVLATTSASAPASSAARAISAMSATLGVSLAQIGTRAERLISQIARCVSFADMAKARPSASMFGQEMLASIAATPGSDNASQAAANSSAVSAETLATSGAGTPA